MFDFHYSRYSSYYSIVSTVSDFSVIEENRFLRGFFDTFSVSCNLRLDGGYD